VTSSDSDMFRDVLSRYATGVVVVTTRRASIDHAMTANSFASVSLDPPLVLVCITKDTRFREAMGDGSAPWAVSILGADGLAAAQWFATRGRPLADQFGQFPHHRGRSGALLLDGALGYLECVTEAIYPAGDHDIFIGKVTDLDLGHAGADQSPLLYFNHGFTELTPG
jgi:flavin reductase